VKASVLIPTLNGADRLRRLLASLDGDSQVIVIDNGSTDHTSGVLAGEFPDVEVISLPRNEGFSRAVNRGAREAEGDALVLVNDDCICYPGFVGNLVGALDTRGGSAMAAGVLLEARHPDTIDSAGMEFDDTLLVFDYLNGHPIAAVDAAPPPIGPSGAAAAFLRDAFLEVGGFDEALFAYWEDVDLVLRLREAGASCALAPGALALHDHSATLGSGSNGKNYLSGFGRGYMLRKWGVLSRSRALRAVVRDASICLAQLLVDRNAAGVRGRLDGWRAGRTSARRALSPRMLDSLPRMSLLEESRRRAARRARLRHAANGR
jgi:N-acetylglucosaminyl-diphospho-decaprenol L-rhamnosyltransferase